MKELAESLKIDKDKIGILGFSAGGWLSGSIQIVFGKCIRIQNVNNGICVYCHTRAFDKKSGDFLRGLKFIRA